MTQQMVDALPTINITGDWETRDIHIDGVWLSPRPSLMVDNHSPDGFNWSYGGSGPAQASLAILLKFLPIEEAQRFKADFKWDVIAKLPKSDFDITIDLKEKINTYLKEGL